MSVLSSSESEVTLEVCGRAIAMHVHANGVLECFATLDRNKRRPRSFAVLARETYLPLNVSQDGARYRVSPAGGGAGAGAHGDAPGAAELPTVTLDSETGMLRVENSAGTAMFEAPPPLLERVLAVRGGDAERSGDAERTPAARAAEQPRAAERDGVMLRAASTADACFYGLGQRTGALDKRGRTYQMWNSDEPFQRGTTDPLYQAIPLLLHSRWGRCDGVFVDFPGRSWFDVADRDATHFSITVEDEAISFFVVPGPTIAATVRRYTELTGRMLLPPLWAIGYHQSRYSYYPDHRVRVIAEEFARRGIPCDAVYLDIHYMDGYRVFTWDPSRFPDPARLVEELHRLGTRVVTIVDPGVKVDSSYHTFTEGMRREVFARRSDGTLYRGEVWPGEAAFPDFTRREARSFWAEQHEALFRHGVDGIWNDMNEPADFSGDFFDRTKFTPPSEVMLEADGRPRSIDHYHNVYGSLMCRATADAFARRKPDERAFILTRAGYAGIQRFAAVWTGDNDSSWDHLAVSVPMLLNLGLSGVAFAGADVGGFQGDADPELFARWMQAACLTPFMRAHTARGTRDHEPWVFGPRVEAIAREAIRLRYSLLPYLYACFVAAHRSGLPVMRPLVLEFEEDPRCRRLWDQFMCGAALLVAPVLQPAQERRLVYLPDGEWYPLNGDRRHGGRQDLIVDTPLEHLPVFVRAGSVVPRQVPRQNTGAPAGNELELGVYPAGSAFESSSSVFDDDGLTHAHYDGRYRETVFELRGNERSITLGIDPVHTGFEPVYRAYRVRLYGVRGESAGELRARLVGPEVETAQPSVTADGGRSEVIVPVASHYQELQLSW